MRSIQMIPFMFGLLITIDALAENTKYIFKPEGSNFYIYGYGNKNFIITQNRLNNLKLDRKIMQLSSGKRIIMTSDDPAGSAVSEKMNSILLQLKQESMNSEDMKNMTDFIESSVAQDQELLQRIRLLIIQASNGILNAEDREEIQVEINQLLNQINMNAKFIQFNANAVIPDLTAEMLGLDAIDVVRSVQESMKYIDEALTRLAKKRIIQGVKSNILTFQIEGKAYQYMNFQKVESGISDLDMSEGISELIKDSVQIKTNNGLLFKSK